MSYGDAGSRIALNDAGPAYFQQLELLHTDQELTALLVLAYLYH